MPGAPAAAPAAPGKAEPVAPGPAPALGAPGIASGDRALFTGSGQRHGKQCDVADVRRAFATARFDDGAAMLVLVRDLHPVPRRPPPMW